MTIAGIVMMSLAWIAIIGLTVYCFSRMFGEKR